MNDQSSRNKGEEQMFLATIREILLREDRATLDDVQAILSDPVKLSEKISPIIDYHLDSLKRQFPAEYERTVNRMIENKLKESQDDLLNVIYPVLGKMIRKYVNQQFQSLKDGVDERFRSIFSTKLLMQRLRALVTGVKDSELLLSHFDEAGIEEVYVIQRDSGLLMGSYSRNQTMDKDLIAGMLTAIKSFVEDAFLREREELEFIQYGTYKILIQSFHSYYISIALGGSLSATEKERLSNLVLEFAEKELSFVSKHWGDDDSEVISEKLKEYFGGSAAPASTTKKKRALQALTKD